MTRSLFAVTFTLLLISPAWGDIKLENVRTASWNYGVPHSNQERIEITAGECVYFLFQVVGAKTNENGLANIAAKVAVEDQEGRTQSSEFSNKAYPVGDRVIPMEPNQVFAIPGTYKTRVTISDLNSGSKAEFAREIVVRKPAGLQAINFKTFHDPEGKYAASWLAALGEYRYFRLEVIGFERDRKEIKLRMETQLFDADNKPQLAKPFVVQAGTKDPAQVAVATSAGFGGVLTFSKAGDFKLRMKIVDEMSGKETVLEVPFTVHEVHKPQKVVAAKKN